MGIEKLFRQGVSALVDTVTAAVADATSPPPPGPDSSTGPAPAGLGADITDISAFGGWRDLLAVIADDREELARLEAMLGGRSPGRVSLNEFPATRQMAGRRPRLVLALDLAMPGNHADLRPVLGNQFGGTIDEWLVRIWRGPEPQLGITADDLIRLGAARGAQPADVVRSTLTSLPGWIRANPKRLPGMAELVIAHPEVVTALLSPPKRDQMTMWKFVAELPPTALAALAPALCDAATCGSSEVRRLAKDLVAKLPPDLAIEELRRIIGDSPATKRTHAVRLLADAHGHDGRADFDTWAAEHLAGDRSGAVQDALAEIADRFAEHETTEAVVLPTVELPLIDSGDRALRTIIDNASLDAALAVLNGVDPSRNVVPARSLHAAMRSGKPLPASLGTGHLIRLALAKSPQFWASAYFDLFERVGKPTPLQFDAVAEHDGTEPRAAVGAVVELMASKSDYWSSEELTPWVVRNGDRLADMLRDTKANHRTLPSNGVVNVLRLVDPVPRRVDEALVRAALTGPKDQRARLQELVGAERFALAEPSITSRTKSERLAAAQWVEARQVAAAAEPLRKAARNESDPLVLAAQLSALQAIGGTTDEFTGRDRLLEDARAAMKKKSAVPKAMAWLDPTTLPPLRWNDGSEVDPDIVTWLLALAVKSKSPAPTTLARQYMSEMDRDALRTFGRELFERWIAEDLRTMPADEARETARQQAPGTLQWRQRFEPTLTVEQVELELFNRLVRKIAGSASASKGLLGVVAASAGGDVADRAMSYIRTHRGRRVNQAKAMLTMLAWLDEPAAVQALMAVAARFRPKGIETEAVAQAKLLAERRGWTMEDLADRSVPDGGFDADGRQRFDYGSRTFTAHLEDDLAVTLHNDETGKTVRSLPKARAADDEELVADVRADLKALKKDLKATTKLQPTRLHQAMCVQRRWELDTFDRYILRHPVMIRLATRLIWVARDPDGGTVGFRPLTDGTLIGVDDDEITIADGSTVGIGHEVTLSDESAAWRDHMADYEIAPLFPQFGRRPPEFGPDQRSIEEFVGHMIGAGTLRSQLDRNNWLLGHPQDAGVVHEIVKNMPDLGYSLVVDLIGGIPIGGYHGEDWQCALGSMYAVSRGERQSPKHGRHLSRIDPILLAESYAEVQAIAAAGTGFDPGYRKKTG